ncbi:MAG: glycine cleavage system protein GcvH [Pseudomonadota bacterium]|jgi:glycine cleavage system H protein
MSEVAEHLWYASTHEWVQVEANSQIRVGISDFAQQQLGDLVYIELPRIGRQFVIGEQCATVESVKAASDLSAPVTGTILAINEAVIDSPELVNDAPYQQWLFVMTVENAQQLDGLFNPNAYRALIHETD